MPCYKIIFLNLFVAFCKDGWLLAIVIGKKYTCRIESAPLSEVRQFPEMEFVSFHRE